MFPMPRGATDQIRHRAIEIREKRRRVLSSIPAGMPPAAWKNARTAARAGRAAGSHQQSARPRPDHRFGRVIGDRPGCPDRFANQAAILRRN